MLAAVANHAEVIDGDCSAAVCAVVLVPACGFVNPLNVRREFKQEFADVDAVEDVANSINLRREQHDSLAIARITAFATASKAEVA